MAVCMAVCVFYGRMAVCIYGHMVVVVVTYVGGYSKDIVLIGLWMFSMVYSPKTSHGR